MLSHVLLIVLMIVLMIAAAVTFCLGTGFIKGRDAAAEFFTAYVVEQSLSVDNLFIFIMLFDYFKVPSELQVRYRLFLVSCEP